MHNRSVLVIGYGNSLRRDDGAGLILAAALVDAWQRTGLPVTLITDHQLNPELADDIAVSNPTSVLFVDAADATGWLDAQITLTRLASVNAEGLSPSVGHHLTPSAVMLYARELFGYRGDAWLITVPGYDFAHGEKLSERTQALVQDYASRADGLWQSFSGFSLS